MCCSQCHGTVVPEAAPLGHFLFLVVVVVRTLFFRKESWETLISLPRHVTYQKFDWLLHVTCWEDYIYRKKNSFQPLKRMLFDVITTASDCANHVGDQQSSELCDLLCFTPGPCLFNELHPREGLVLTGLTYAPIARQQRFRRVRQQDAAVIRRCPHKCGRPSSDQTSNRTVFFRNMTRMRSRRTVWKYCTSGLTTQRSQGPSNFVGSNIVPYFFKQMCPHPI